MEVFIDTAAGAKTHRIGADIRDHAVFDRDGFVQRAVSRGRPAQRVALGRRADADILSLMDLLGRTQRRAAIGTARFAEIVTPGIGIVARIALVAATDAAAECEDL